MEEDTLYDKVTLPYTDMAPKGGETPFFLVILLLIFFPPAAWYVMWREKEYHRVFAYLIGLYGIATIIGSFLIRQIFIPKANEIYSSLHLQQPSVNPFAYTTIYVVLGMLEIGIALLLYFISRKNNDLPKSWLIVAVSVLAGISLIQPITQAFLTYSALNSVYQQTRVTNSQ